MASTDLHWKHILQEMGWTQAQLCERLGVRPATASQWGKSDAPVYAYAYLRLALAIKRKASDLNRLIEF